MKTSSIEFTLLLKRSQNIVASSIVFLLLFFAVIGAASAEQIIPCSNTPNGDAPPKVNPDPLPNPVTGGVVYNAGQILRNVSTETAGDVHIGLKIPTGILGVVSENINQLSFLGSTGTAIVKETLNNLFSSEFDKDVLFTNFTIPPGGCLNLGASLESEKINGLKWLSSTTFTSVSPRAHPIATDVFAGGLTAIPTKKDPVIYTFSNDGNTDLFINRIALGWFPTLVDVNNFSLGMLNDLNLIPVDTTLVPNGDIAFTVPFDFPLGAFLVADITGTGTGSDGVSMPLAFVQQHQSSIPEPATSLLWLLGLGGLTAFRILGKIPVVAQSGSVR